MDLAEAARSSQSVEICNRAGNGPLVILCEHAAHEIPETYQGLGLDPALLQQADRARRVRVADPPLISKMFCEPRMPM